MSDARDRCIMYTNMHKDGTFQHVYAPESLTDDEQGNPVLLLSEARTLLEDIVDNAIIPLTVYTGCKHCFTRQGESHEDYCLVLRTRKLLGEMAQAGYTE